jgi:hypothetical protein
MPLDPDFRIVNGVPRLRASYIMRRDPRARAAYEAIRRRGASAEEAASQIEYAFQQSFLEVVLDQPDLPLQLYLDACAIH